MVNVLRCMVRCVECVFVLSVQSQAALVLLTSVVHGSQGGLVLLRPLIILGSPCAFGFRECAVCLGLLLAVVSVCCTRDLLLFSVSCGWP